MKNWIRSAARGAVVIVSLLACACDTAGVQRAYMALDEQGMRRRDVFYTDTEAIFCVAELVSGTDDVTVRGQLTSTYLELPTGEVVDRHVLHDVSEAAPGAGEDLRVSFELEKESSDDPYVPGKYACEIYVNGELEETLPFEIRFPACPETALRPGLKCAGFFRTGTQCPAAIAGSVCTCNEDGTWGCS